MVGISHFQQHDEWMLGEQYWKMEISEEVVAVDSQVRLVKLKLWHWTGRYCLWFIPLLCLAACRNSYVYIYFLHLALDLLAMVLRHSSASWYLRT